MSLSFLVVEGRIVRKRKRRECIVLGIAQDANDEEEGVCLLPPTNILVSYDHPSLPFCFLDAIVRIQAQFNENDQLCAHVIDLVQCAPDTKAVQYVLQGVLDGTLPEWSLPVTSRAELQEIAMNTTHTGTATTTTTRNRKHEIAKMVRLLKGGAADRDPRQRRPHTKRCDLELLEVVESRMGPSLRPINNDRDGTSKPWEELTVDAFKAITPLPISPLQLLSMHNVPDLHRVSRGLTREEYILGKKHPQVRWMTERIQQLRREPHHILDVGGGRGDLTMCMAQALPTCMITIVDKNESSLEAGRQQLESATAEAAAVVDRISFVHADFNDFTEDPSSHVSATAPPIDLVVALHACGDLSDLALSFARRLEIPFVICPCCYTKRCIPQFHPMWNKSWTDHEIHVMCKLAELNERPNESKRARRIINSMRLGDIDESEWALYLEEYDSMASLRNMVLVGDR